MGTTVTAWILEDKDGTYKDRNSILLMGDVGLLDWGKTDPLYFNPIVRKKTECIISNKRITLSNLLPFIPVIGPIFE